MRAQPGRLLLYALAERFGIPDVEELGARLSRDQVAWWDAYFDLKQEREDQRQLDRMMEQELTAGRRE